MVRKSWVQNSLVILVFSVSLAACGDGASPTATPTGTSDTGGNAADFTIRFVGDSADVLGAQLDIAAAADFTRRTGIKVEVIPGPSSSTDRLAQYQQYLLSRSPQPDVYQIDVIWPGILADDLLDLGPYIPKDQIAANFPALVQNDTVKGKLVAVPYYGDAGLLFYRTDLLQKYGIAGPPDTWDALEADARKIQDGERAVGNADFWGFVWHGSAYEGLTCEALEWQASQGGGVIIDPDGQITVNNPQAAAALDRAAGWINTISPPAVLTYQEADARAVWQAGNAAFMRNWPGSYAQGNAIDPKTGKLPPIAGKFDVTTLPAGTGPGARHAATLGGWQLAVSQYTQHPKEAAQFVTFLTAWDHEKERAIKGGNLPTLKALYADPDVLAANPYFSRLLDVFTNAVARPSTVAGAAYGDVSTAYFTTVHKVLTGETTGRAALNTIEAQLKTLLK
jgi:trehalose/maltose transport system substrate-binding protein